MGAESGRRPRRDPPAGSGADRREPDSPAGPAARWLLCGRTHTPHGGSLAQAITSLRIRTVRPRAVDGRVRQRRRHQLRRHHHDRLRRGRRLRRRRGATAQLDLDELCQEAKDAGVEAPDGFTVRLVTDIGKVDDGTFNQYAYEGMKAAEECFGFETSYIETASEADYEKNINTALEGDPDIVITVGFLITDAHEGGRRGEPRGLVHRCRPVPSRVPRQLSGSSTTRTKAATWRA